MTASPHQISHLLARYSNGDQAALDQLMPLVYGELRKMARRYMRGQPAGHTLQTTALIHEAYLKLVGQQEKRWRNRAHFFGVAAQAMRHILVDYARSRHAAKRGGEALEVSLDETALVTQDRAAELVALGYDERAAYFIETPPDDVAAAMLAGEQSQSMPGRTIGHYQILSLLGAGGMGEVYLAEDTRLKRKVALKVLPVYFTADRDRLRRFEQEARAASTLNHPNIITIHEIGEIEE